MKIGFRVSCVESFRQGIDGPTGDMLHHWLDVDPSTLSEADRQLIADRMSPDGQVRARYTRYESPEPLLASIGVLASSFTVAGLLAAIRAENEAAEKYAAEQQAAAEKYAADAVAKAMDCPVSLSTTTESLHLTQRWGVEAHWDKQPVATKSFQYAVGTPHKLLDRSKVTAEQLAAIDARHAEVKASCDAANADAKAAAFAAATAELEAIAAERREWVTLHGSTVLRQAVADGMLVENLYQHERLEYEHNQRIGSLRFTHVGWCAVDEDELDEVDAVHLEESDMAILNSARYTDRNARLMTHTATGRVVAAVALEGGDWAMWPDVVMDACRSAE